MIDLGQTSVHVSIGGGIYKWASPFTALSHNSMTLSEATFTCLCPFLLSGEVEVIVRVESNTHHFCFTFPTEILQVCDDAHGSQLCSLLADSNPSTNCIHCALQSPLCNDCRGLGNGMRETLPIVVCSTNPS